MDGRGDGGGAHRPARPRAARDEERQLATATVKKPPLAQWHLVRVIAIGDRMQAWLNGALLLDHRDPRFRAGRVGLWTKADSITAFDDLAIRGVSAGGAR